MLPPSSGQHVPPKRRYPPTSPHSVTTQNSNLITMYLKILNGKARSDTQCYEITDYYTLIHY
jgi:hypothetical protein